MDGRYDNIKNCGIVSAGGETSPLDLVECPGCTARTVRGLGCPACAMTVTGADDVSPSTGAVGEAARGAVVELSVVRPAYDVLMRRDEARQVWVRTGNRCWRVAGPAETQDFTAQQRDPQIADWIREQRERDISDRQQRAMTRMSCAGTNPHRRALAVLDLPPAERVPFLAVLSDLQRRQLVKAADVLPAELLEHLPTSAPETPAPETEDDRG